jgi:predicted chitinase
MIDITDPIQTLWPNCPIPLLQGIIDTSDDVFAKCQINSRDRLVPFMATISAESAGGIVLKESMFYTNANRLRKVWPSRFRDKSDAELAHLLRNEKALADNVYGSRMGNEDNGTKDDDGYTFRGQGLLQTTGKRAVRELSQFVGIDLVEHPDALTSPDTALLCAAVDFVVICRCLPYCDERNFQAVSGLVNVGSPTASASQIVGWSERQNWHRKWSEALS